MRSRINLKRALARFLVVLAAMGATAVVAQAPAQAAHTDCGYSRICVWSNDQYSGQPTYYWSVTGTNPPAYCVNFGGSLNDNVDSWKITGGRAATMYSNANCGGSIVSHIKADWAGGPNRMNCFSINWGTLSCFNGANQGSSMWVNAA